MGTSTVTAPTAGDRLVLVSHALCPYVQRAVIALREKGMPFERIDIDLADKPAWFLALSPLGKTPVLLVPRDGAFVAVFESAVICEYLDDTQAPALHPADPLDRARHRAWVELASATLQQIWQYYTAKDDDAFARARQALHDRFVQVERALDTRGPWFDGARFGFVDAAFGPVFRYLDVFERFCAPEALPQTGPRVGAWRRALAGRPAVRAAVGSGYAAGLRRFVEAQQGVLGRLSRLARRPADQTCTAAATPIASPIAPRPYMPQ